MYLYQLASSQKLLAGNKVDLENQRVVSKEREKQLRQEWNISFFETSAITGHNIDRSFQTLASVSNVCISTHRGKIIVNAFNTF